MEQMLVFTFIPKSSISFFYDFILITFCAVHQARWEHFPIFNSYFETEQPGWKKKNKLPSVLVANYE